MRAPDNYLYMIKHIASQTGSTPVHLNKESIKGLRNLHNLVHNEDAEHDFSKLKTLFAQPNIAIHLKGQIAQKKANGGIINDYINTLKNNGSGEDSELSLAPNELIKFLDDSGYPYMTNSHTGHKEYHLGNMFDGLNNIFKPIKDSMRTREHHGWGDMIGGLGSAAYNAASTLGNAAYNAGAYAAPIIGNAASNLGSAAYEGAKYAAPIVGNAAYNAGAYAAPIIGSAASTLGNAAYEGAKYAAPIVGSAAYNAASNVLGKDAAEGLSSAASTLGNAAYDAGAYAAPIIGNAASNLGSAAYEAGKYAAPIIGSAASTLGNAAYDAGAYAAPIIGDAAYNVGQAAYDRLPTNPFGSATSTPENTASTPENGASQPSFTQNVMRGIAGPIGGAIGGLTGQFAGQKVGQKLSEGIPFVGPFVGPLAGNIAGNVGYKAGAYQGRKKGVEYADRLYNYLGGGDTSASNPAPAPNPTSNSTSYFPTFSGFGDTISGFGNNAYNAASNFGTNAYNAAQALGNKIYELGTNAYNAASNVGQAAYDRLPTNPFANLSNKYAHGGHVHNLVDKAYQRHGFGGNVHDFSNAVVKKINDHLPSIPNHQRLEDIGNQIRKIPEYVHSGTQHIAQIAPKFEHGAKLAQELLKRYVRG